MKTSNFTGKIYREKTVKKFQTKINLFGYKNSYNAINFLNLRTFLCIITFFVIISTSNYGYFLAPLLTISLYLILPYILIDYKLKKREKRLEQEAMYFFEILTLSLESGKNLTNALEITTENIDSLLSDEFKYCLEEVKFGKSLDEALMNLKERIPSDTINNIILNISQANIFGNNIIETLYNQVDFIREKKVMNIKEVMNKIPLKVSIISVIFFVPIIMLILLGPILAGNFLG